jgi:DnaJ family protein C protein 9
MNQENYITQQIKLHFGSTNLYEIFQVSSEAKTSEIKKAYMKLALKHHPDKGGDAGTFQALSMIHSILSDEEKRKIYNESGLIDSDADDNLESSEQNFEFWNDYFRALFPKLTISAIEKFAKEYIGSKEEETDLLNAYEKCSGDCLKIMDLIMFAEEGEEQRIVSKLDSLIKENKIVSNKKYEKSKEKLLQKYEKYIQKIVNEQEIEDDGEQNKKKRKHSKKESETANGDDDLAMLIQMKNQKKSENDLFSKIISKYSDRPEKEGKKKNKKEKESEMVPDDEEFERFQKSLFAEKENNNKNKDSGSKKKAKN